MNQLRHNVQTARSILKDEGVKALFRRYGWKLFAVVFFYYLIRDVTLYVLLPMLIVKAF